MASAGLNHQSNNGQTIQQVQGSLAISAVDGVVSDGHNHARGTEVLYMADDGFNWRKYGQKHVGGSRFPRSYYKCTHPKCEVKKLFERSQDGGMIQIIYKGTHNHPKPQPSHCYFGSVIKLEQEENSKMISPLTGRDERALDMHKQLSHRSDPIGKPEELSPGIQNNDFCVKNDELDDNDDWLSKLSMLSRKMYAFTEVTPAVKPIRETRVVVRTLSEVDILDDGYRWRKYGQKVVRENPNPRSYYKCTSSGCPVRKHVERASDNPKAIITTYEGKHDHNVPAAKKPSNHKIGR